MACERAACERPGDRAGTDADRAAESPAAEGAVSAQPGEPPAAKGAVAEGAVIVAIAAGDAHSLALDDCGYCYAWGSNATGQCGVQGERDSLREPTLVSDLSHRRCLAVSAAPALSAFVASEISPRLAPALSGFVASVAARAAGSSASHLDRLSVRSESADRVAEPRAHRTQIWLAGSPTGFGARESLLLGPLGLAKFVDGHEVHFMSSWAASSSDGV